MLLRILLLAPGRIRRKSVETLMEILEENALNLQQHAESQNSLPALPLVPATARKEENESMDSITNSVVGDVSFPRLESTPTYYHAPVIIPAYVSPFFSFSAPYWPGNSATEPSKAHFHSILKSTAVQPKSPINVDELLGMSRLNLSNNEAGSSLDLHLSHSSYRNDQAGSQHFMLTQLQETQQ